jgi:hypothetical protein
MSQSNIARYKDSALRDDRYESRFENNYLQRCPFRCILFKEIFIFIFLSSLTFWNYFQNHRNLCVIRKVNKMDWPLAEPTSFAGLF